MMYAHHWSITHWQVEEKKVEVSRTETTIETGQEGTIEVSQVDHCSKLMYLGAIFRVYFAHLNGLTTPPTIDDPAH